MVVVINCPFQNLQEQKIPIIWAFILIHLLLWVYLLTFLEIHRLGKSSKTSNSCSNPRYLWRGTTKTKIKLSSRLYLTFVLVWLPRYFSLNLVCKLEVNLNIWTSNGWFISWHKRCTTHLSPSNCFRKNFRTKLLSRWDNWRLLLKTQIFWDNIIQLWRSKWERNISFYSITNTWAFIISELPSWSSCIFSCNSTRWLIWSLNTSSLWKWRMNKLEITLHFHYFLWLQLCQCT